ncbi:MAG TPA: TatD family hydrolase [Tepidiformaceae bacterium]|nr:TatD family hydrolase [Tepidiformaceae bacterium]
MPPWFDTHVHLDRYPIPEREALLERANEANVAVFAVAVDLASSREVSAITGLRGRVVGIHPKNAGPDFPEEMHEIARRPGVRAIGECGFDAEGPPWGVQAATFEAQCELARGLDESLVLHVAGPGAWDSLVEHERALAGLRVVRHYFTGDAAEAAWHRERGHWLSFGNPLRRLPTLREIAHDYPPDLLLIETDSYPLPGRDTEPKHVVRIGETLALLRGWTFEQAREQLAQNTQRAFAAFAPGS